MTNEEIEKGFCQFGETRNLSDEEYAVAKAFWQFACQWMQAGQAKKRCENCKEYSSSFMCCDTVYPKGKPYVDASTFCCKYWQSKESEK
jgi:hypothetical protein